MTACLPGITAHAACTRASWSGASKPGFGIVKAAFVAQLVLPPSPSGGCLDRHHLRAAGLDTRTFGRVPTNIVHLRQHITAYLDTCKQLGGSDRLWDAWCTQLSLLRRSTFYVRLHPET